MTLWKNTCGGSWQGTIENGGEVSGKPGAFLFFIPKGALTHHLLKQAVVSLPLVGHVRSPRGIASPAGAAGQGCIFAKLPALPTQSAQGLPFWNPLFMGWQYTTPSRRLPAQTCHRQLCRRYRAPLVVRRISRRTERKQGCPVSGHPFQKGQGDLWRFIIWRPRWSAVEPDAPPWLLRPI